MPFSNLSSNLFKHNILGKGVAIVPEFGIVVAPSSGVINIIPLLGCVISVIGYIFFLVLFIMGMINGFSGKAKELPLVGKIRIIK